MSAKKNLQSLTKQGASALLPNKIKIMVGTSSCGIAAGAHEVYTTLASGIQRKKLDAVVTITGCIGLCHLEPLVDVILPGESRYTYANVTPKTAGQLLNALAKQSLPAGAIGWIDREDMRSDSAGQLRTTASADQTASGIPALGELPFYRKQLRIAMRNCGFINPENMTEYIARGGYQALEATLHGSTPAKVISEIERSGLRGRGGAGFETGKKWRVCRNARAAEKYIICNADEGDPGAYMDRSILEGDPHAVLEGMSLAAFAIGASRGFIYVRAEYPLAIARLEKALDQARKHGLLGPNMFESGFDFDITLVMGAGAFVCGEETALIRSIEGECGEPCQRPPYPAECGLWGKPTVINNVETLASVSAIMHRGASWYRSIGTEQSRGTKVFSLVGTINRVGLIEVPMGTTLREIIFDIGGGIPGGKAFKAVQTGGPSGGCIPEKFLDLPVDYDALSRAGSIMGSGGMIVMDEKTCMVDIARYFLSFLEHESCGKCTPCRVGIKRLRELLDKICNGDGEKADLKRIEKTARLIQQSAFCGLGRTAPNPVLSTLACFKAEYLEHINNKRCPAGVCKALTRYSINTDACIGCGACIKACPAGAVSGQQKKAHTINTKKCIACGACREVCPTGAVVT